ncbi:MAG: ImmA/IrrE family metallo-endopeptidase [Solirubrobacterales bacterium]|nr:ImmA/IrrE family metallo-endopeptidase [Solirubrobacterales bacterium]HRV60515.1 ImmA/IrrE family metallo-endopeptidase [Solirubrobacterales bacterium]
MKVASLEPGEIDRIECEVGEIMAAVPPRVWDGESLPVPIDSIAREVYGLKVREVSHDQMREIVGDQATEGTMSGLLLTGIGEIWVNDWEARQPEWGSQRKRFTIGHELGHFAMHQSGPPAIYCRASDSSESAEDAPTPHPVPELEANTFSAAFLMPASLVRPEIGPEGVDGDQLKTLMLRFDSSAKAMRRRVETLRLIA